MAYNQSTADHLYACPDESHNLLMGYVLWIFGFMGCHRFFYGKKLSGCLWFFTGGLLGIGWLIDLFLIPTMPSDANRLYSTGTISYNICWALLVPLGVFGLHRFYMGKWLSGIIWLCTGGLLGIGILYDMLTLNEQISVINASGRL